MAKSDQNEYWSVLKKLRCHQSNKSPDSTITSTEWLDYFSKLYTDKNNNSSEIEQALATKENKILLIVF